MAYYTWHPLSSSWLARASYDLGRGYMAVETRAGRRYEAEVPPELWGRFLGTGGSKGKFWNRELKQLPWKEIR